MTSMVYDEIVQSILIIVERLDLSSSKSEAADSGVYDACRGKKLNKIMLLQVLFCSDKVKLMRRSHVVLILVK